MGVNFMNKQRYLATYVSICGLFAALSVVIMLAAYLGVTTYAVPALAGALLIIIFLEFGVKSAFTVYLAVSVLSFLVCEKEAALCYLLFFGYYPFLKAYIERVKNKVLQWILKILLFTVSFTAVTLLGVWILGIPVREINMGFGNFGFALFGLSLEVMFIIYDIALTKIITLYIVKYQEKFRKTLRLNKSK